MVPFGLAQAPTYFQALISKVLNGLHTFTMTYLDDIIIFSRTLGTSQDHLPETKRSQIEAQVIQMQLHKEIHTISWSSYITRRNTAPP